MAELLAKFVLISLLMSVSSVHNKRASRNSLAEIGNSESDDNDLESEKWKEKWKEQSRWRTNSNKNIPFKLISGNSKVWRNVGHAQPLKRSDTNQTPIIPLVESYGGVNMTDPISKNHCPINLLYGNNLTVKNFFLMVPSNNGSLNETINRFKTFEEKEVAGSIPDSPQKAQQTTNEVDTVVINATPENTTGEWGTPMMTENISNISQELVELTPSSANATVTASMENTTKVEETTSESWASSNSSDVITAAEENITIATEIPCTTSNESLSVSVYQDNSTSTPILSGNLSTLEPLDGMLASTITTATIDLSQIMRTVNKYCETFNLTADNGTYTILPVNIGQQAQLYNTLDDEPKLQQISRINKSKRNSFANKRHRRQIKRAPIIK